MHSARLHAQKAARHTNNGTQFASMPGVVDNENTYLAGETGSRARPGPRPGPRPGRGPRAGLGPRPGPQTRAWPQPCFVEAPFPTSIDGYEGAQIYAPARWKTAGAAATSPWSSAEHAASNPTTSLQPRARRESPRALGSPPGGAGFGFRASRLFGIARVGAELGQGPA